MAASMQDPTDTGGALIAASQVSGTSVYDAAGEKLGSVHDLMLDKISGKVEYAVLSFGGFLGIGDRYHPLPWSALRYDEIQGGYIVEMTREKLEGAPTYTAAELSAEDAMWGPHVRDYYYVAPI